jgi:hypothetical protein
VKGVYQDDPQSAAYTKVDNGFLSDGEEVNWEN